MKKVTDPLCPPAGAFYRPSPIVDAGHPAILARARGLASRTDGPQQTAAACFRWVRDHVSHTVDAGRGPVTCVASDVLRHRTGICFAKSHLLAALLRASGLAAGLCYQRLSQNDQGPPFTLHGLVAVWLDGVGWYRCDPRGNRGAVFSDFIPPQECLAYVPRLAGEQDIAGIFPDPLPQVVAALTRHQTLPSLLADLPDLVQQELDITCLS